MITETETNKQPWRIRDWSWSKSVGRFKSSMEYYTHSGEPKHVLGGLAIITALFGVPWYYLTRGTKQLSHQDYLEKAEKADKARKARLSSSTN